MLTILSDKLTSWSVSSKIFLIPMADKKKILIVDYDVKSLDSLAHLFSPYNIQTIKATDGKMAYSKYQSEKPDLILLEAMIPKLHGFDLAQKIYRESKGSVPVVIITGIYKGPQYKKEAYRSYGVADYFEKPFDRAKLVTSVMNLLHEEIEIEENLPDPESVLKLLLEIDDEGSPGQKKEKAG